MPHPRARSALVLVLACACAVDAAREADRPFQTGLAAVEQLDLLPRPEPRWTLRAVARGELSDSCTSIHGEHHERRGRLIRVTLQTRRRSRAGCVGESRPFSRVLMIPLGGLSPGLYTLEVNGVRQLFDVPVPPELQPGIDLREPPFY